MINEAIVIEGDRFPWREARAEFDRLVDADRPNAAAAIADPGICSCPRCHRYYWAEGTRQECPACHAQYETDWWCMLSWGVQHGRIIANPDHPMHKWHLKDPQNELYARRSSVFRWGMAHPDCSLGTIAVWKATDWIEVWAGRSNYIRDGEMVGGKVAGIVRKGSNGKELLLNVVDRPYQCNEYCAVRCIEPDDVTVAVGDSVWWQAGKVYWTPKEGRRGSDQQDERRDVPMVKIGYSH